MTEGHQQRVSRIHTLGTTLGKSRSTSPSNSNNKLRNPSPINPVPRNERWNSSSRIRTTGRSPLDGPTGTSSAKPSPAKSGRSNTPPTSSGREHLKRPAGEVNSMPRSGKKKLNHDLRRDGADPNSANSTPRSSRTYLGSARALPGSHQTNRSRSPRPKTPESVNMHEQKLKSYTTDCLKAKMEEKGKEVNLFASPISRAKRNAKVPQLYLSAGTTPPPSQIYKSKKRIQKRILVMAGSQEPVDPLPEYSGGYLNQDTYSSPVPILNLSLPPAPNLEELSRTDDDVISDFQQGHNKNNSRNGMDEDSEEDQEEDLGLMRKSIDAEDLSEFSKECNAGGSRQFDLEEEVDAAVDTFNAGIGSLIPLHPADIDDLAFLYLRHQPVSDSISSVTDEIKCDGSKKLSIIEVKEGIKKALSLPIGYEASLIGEILSRDTADVGYCDALSSSDSPSTGRRISAPVLSRSPLAKWKHSKEVRRVSEGAVPLDKENSGPWLIESRDDPSGTKSRESLVDPVSASEINKMKESPEPQPPISNTVEDNHSSSTAPFDGSGGTPPASSRTKHMEQQQQQHQRRTLDEPEECDFSTNVQKPCRRRSISEPHGRTGGPGGVMGSAIKEAIASAYFTLNPSIFEDRRVWGISEFKKLCMMINVDTSKCRDYNDYVSLLQEWNHKPNVLLIPSFYD